MGMSDLIRQKQSGAALSPEQLAWWIAGVTDGSIPDYQTTALLMAIWFQGLDVAETTQLTACMADSGQRVDLTGIEGIKVDKHSTGGVGDTTTLVTAPLVAACGVPVAKMSGRGLGHTGGTVDKLETIPGFRTALTIEQMAQVVAKAGLCVAGQSAALAPADKIIYALRDVTSTVDQMGLIAASIMSKKLAAGSDAIVLDVKTGSGAFMNRHEDAFALAQMMVDIGRKNGKIMRALVTDMAQPLGNAVGNALEVREAVELLTGTDDTPLWRVCLMLGIEMLGCAGWQHDEAAAALEKARNSGMGFERLCRMAQAQGGDARWLEHPEKMVNADRHMIFAQHDGFVGAMDTQKLGHAALLLGAGRERAEDTIDADVGFGMCVRLGDMVKRGQPLAELYHKTKGLPQAIGVFEEAIRIEEREPAPVPLCYGIISDEGERG